MTKRRLPVIGITVDTNYGAENRPLDNGLDPKEQSVFWLKKSYTDAVEKSGGVPLLIPVVAAPKHMDMYISMIDGLLISGGEFDIDPSLYGEKPIPQCGALKPDRTVMEMKLLKKALKLGMPVLGICGGHQAINVAFGGTLYQDIPTQTQKSLKHEQKPIPSTQPSHKVDVMKGTLLDAAAKSHSMQVNSTHHQGIKKMGRGLLACATAPDGLVEGVEIKSARKQFLLGVQWHPEQLYDADEASRGIFKSFITACKKFKPH